jgi:hypothetical protein
MGTAKKRDRRWSWTRIVWLAMALGAGFGTWTYFRWRASRPFDAEFRLAEAVARRDWKATYRISLQNQLAQRGVDEEEFSQLMEALTRGLPGSYFDGTRIERIDGTHDEYSRGMHMVFLVFPNAPTADGTRAEQLLHAYRDRSGWRVAINELPIRVSRFHLDTTLEQWSRFSAAMKSAKIESYWITFDGPVLSRSRIDDYLAGRIEQSEIYVKR